MRWIVCARWHERDKEARFTALLHHVDVDSAPGGVLGDQPEGRAGGGRGDVGRPTGRTWRRTSGTCTRGCTSGRYRAKPISAGVHPEGGRAAAAARDRPLEDKIVQRAVVEVLNAVYEVDFLGFSYGFRPGRSPHDALDALAVGIERKKVNWVLDADIRDFFTNLIIAG